MREAELRAMVIRAAKFGGWLVTSMHDSRKQTWGTDRGWPDLFLAKPGYPGGGRAMALELKTQTGRLTVHQQLWLGSLRDAGIDARVIRPADYEALRDELLAPASGSGGRAGEG